MTFKHDPDATLAKLEPGIYRFRIISAGDRFSKAGNAMLALKLGVHDPATSSEQWVFDNLVDVARMKHKTEQFCEALGLDFASGMINGDTLVDRTGFAEFATEARDGYDPRTVVQKYLTEDEARQGGAAPAAGDGIPF